MSDSVDLLITGGTVVDGTGAPPRPGTVVVEGDRMRLLPVDAALPEHVGRRIDATGMVVAPGFIDLHSHGGLVILAEPRHEPKVRQGVTTEIVGVDGNGFAPFENREDLLAFVELDSGLDGRPDLDYDWRTVADYLARYDGTVSVNVGTLVGNSQLRIGALGWDDVPADDGAIDRMRGILRDAMAEGAVGLSTGLDYPPGSYATTEELAALTRTAGEAGGFYHTHVRYQLGDRYLDPFKEAIDIGRRADAPAHITHFYHRETHPGGPEALLALVDDARAGGLDVTFDTYPSEWASTRLLIQLPGWIQEGGPGPLKQRLADQAARDRLRGEFAARGAAYTGPGGWADLRLGAFHRPDLLRWESMTMADVMQETGQGRRRRHLRPAAGRRPRRQPGHERAVVRDAAPVRDPPGRDGRHGFHLHRRQAEPADLRLIPADPRPVRARRRAAEPRGGDPQDDGRGRGPPRPQAARNDPRRCLRRPGRLRPGLGA